MVVFFAHLHTRGQFPQRRLKSAPNPDKAKDVKGSTAKVGSDVFMITTYTNNSYCVLLTYVEQTML